MPQVEETFASYLSPDSASSLKRLTLPTKLSSTTSTLMGKAFQAASQAGAGLHTMAVLQAYKADLSAGSTIDEEAFTELRWATNFSHHATMQPSNQAISSSPHSGGRGCWPSSLVPVLL